jgi:hypothetical protein
MSAESLFVINCEIKQLCATEVMTSTSFQSDIYFLVFYYYRGDEHYTHTSMKRTIFSPNMLEIPKTNITFTSIHYLLKKTSHKQILNSQYASSCGFGNSKFQMTGNVYSIIACPNSSCLFFKEKNLHNSR